MYKNKKIIFLFCLFLMCAGLFSGLIEPASAAITSCQFRCPPGSPTEDAIGRPFSHERNAGFAIEIFTTILSENCGYEELGGVEESWNTYLDSCECAEARSEESAEVFDSDRGVCRFPEGSTATPMGEVSPPGLPEDEKTAPTKDYKAIPIKGIDLPTGQMISGSIPQIVGRVIKAVLGIIGSIALLMFIAGGFLWLTSAGNPERVKKGRDILVWASVGLVVIFISYAMVNFIISGLTGTGGDVDKKTSEGECVCGDVIDPWLTEDGVEACVEGGCTWRTR